MKFCVEKIKTYKVELDDEGCRAFENVDYILTKLIDTMKDKNCKIITCFTSTHEPIQYDIDELEKFNIKLLELQSIFEIST